MARFYQSSLLLLLFAAQPTIAAEPDVAQKQLAQQAEQLVGRAGIFYQAGKYKQSAAEISKAQEIVKSILAENDTKTAQSLLRPFAARLKKAHELLELQGYSLPPLTFSAPMSAKPPATETNRFTRDIAPIFVARCGRCHITKSEGKLNLRTFATLMQGADGEAVIEPGSADDSRLIEMLRSGDMPASGRKLGGNQIATIAAWINAGAKIDDKHKDTPLTRLTPDTKIEPAPRVPSPPQVGKGPVSFAGHIAPVLAANCTGCHGARNPRARLSMVDFTRLMRGGENGPAITPGKGAASLIIRKLKGTEGARMPLERPALPSQTIAAFERWIDEGAKFDGQNPAQTLAELSALYLAKTATHAELGQQRGELAEKNWNLSIPDERPNVVELPNLRLYGTASEAKLKTIGSLANEQTDTVRKLLSVPRDLPFVKGGVTFFVFSRRIDYSEFARMVEKRSVPRDWRGHGKFTIADAYIALVPPKTGTEGLPSLVAQQLASVHLGSLTAGKGPRWLTEGLARAVAAKIAPKDSRVKQWQDQLTELKRSASSSADFLTPTLPPADADVLSYGFAASLVKDSSRLKRFLTELGKGTSTEDAFSKAFGASVKERADTWLRSGRRRKR